MHGFRKMNRLIEIIRLVIPVATSVPAAFDTSFGAFISEGVEAVTNAIQESMKQDSTLSHL
jgi:hypothetical protein